MVWQVVHSNPSKTNYSRFPSFSVYESYFGYSKSYLFGVLRCYAG
ncbi:unnamed protein product [Brassica oleracea]